MGNRKRRDTEGFDVFISYDRDDVKAARTLARRFRRRGLIPWLDECELRPGLPWQNVLERQVEQVRAAAVLVGRGGLGPWQDVEHAAFLRQFVRRGCPVVPVILAGCERYPRLPVFLDGMTWVDFRRSVPDPFEHLIWGITGIRSQRRSA
jgi:hypothetical protein